MTKDIYIPEMTIKLPAGASGDPKAMVTELGNRLLAMVEKKQQIHSRPLVKISLVWNPGDSEETMLKKITESFFNQFKGLE